MCVAFKPILYPLNSPPPSKSTSLQFRDKDAMSLCMTKVMLIMVMLIIYLNFCSDRSVFLCYSTIEGHQIGQPSMKPFWQPWINSLSCMCLNMASRRIHSTTFPGTDVKLTALFFPGSSLLSILKNGNDISLFPVIMVFVLL